MAKEISALGLQVVPPEAVVVSRHYLQSVETLADIGLRAERCRQVRLGGTDEAPKRRKPQCGNTNGFLRELTGSIHRSNYEFTLPALQPKR
jgi:hypothetical protein